MPVRVDVQPSLLSWAAERSGRDEDDLRRRFPRLLDWLEGASKPTVKQLEGFARATNTPFGFMFLPEPPDEPMPVPDFRTMPRGRTARPSPNLLDTIYLCEQRQDWYRNYLRSNGAAPLSFVRSVDIGVGVERAARLIQETLDFGVDARRAVPNWSEALRRFAEKSEEVGVLVMISGVVGSNTHRKLDPQEFRGFALVDDLAPVIFVNGADTKAAQIFTLAHELAHVWLGQTALSNAGLDRRSDDATERWCNAVAGEFLVPARDLRSEFDGDAQLSHEVTRLARTFKVSTLVILRRLFDGGYMNWQAYQAAYDEQLSQIQQVATPGGGNFYNTQPVRTSKQFARAVLSDTMEGRTLHRDAFRLLGVRKYETFRELADHLGAE
ncbi:MAG: ImmA/IrrE family metallo-endopeptidase [Actinobacteria bacterium]|nr:ImmA/IrrE family metallo-endopeptidase [Actinomycetota bacterium]